MGNLVTGEGQMEPWDGRESRANRTISDEDAKAIAQCVEEIRTENEDRQLARAARHLLRAAVLALAAIVLVAAGGWQAFIKAITPS